ncbi:MAG TPA: FeoA family protein [Anaerolineae bacterium]|nr:FeoA family protein [Anaerolineae bacterium]HMR64599.1 FeoA family protein [Anaerolineae bacterium]
MEDANDEYGKRRVVLLSQLTPGQSGTIVRVGGHAAARRRLLEMGLVRGETIRVERVAPLGDPIEFQIKGYHLSLRRQDAAKIEIYISTNGHTKL